MRSQKAHSRAILVVIAIVACLITSSMSLAASYTLGIGDVVRISVWGHSELTTSIEVRPDGYITFPLIGDLYAVGLTTTELAGEIQQKLQTYVVSPSVTVMVTEFRTIKVQVLGEVNRPGYYTLRANDRLMDAVGLAGGPTTLADLTNVNVTRINSAGTTAELFNVNVDDYIRNADVDANPVLLAGDVVYVGETGTALVLGQVKSPGSYTIKANMDLLDLLAQAGGVASGGDMSKATLTRNNNGNNNEFVINLEELMAQGKGDWSLQAGDVLFVPEKEQIVLFGEVKVPGSYILSRNTTIADILGAAGGLTQYGDATNISIIRNNPNGQETLVFDVSKALAGQAGGDNPRLFGGDIVYIPERGNSILVLGEVKQPGSFSFKEHMGVLDLLALAGGATDDAALDSVTLTRQTGSDLSVQEIDVSTLQTTGVGAVTLQPGDVLFVPQGAPQALVLGRVARPGSYKISDEIKLLDLLALAGGPLETAGNQVLVTRAEETLEIDLGGLLRLGIDNQRIKSGDVVYIVEGQHQVLVLGEVRNPGYHKIEFGDRVIDGIAKAGGLLETAAEDDVTLTRRSDADNAGEILNVDLEQLMKNRFLDSNYLLVGGDVIIVPEAQRQVLVLGQVQRPGAYDVKKGQNLLEVLALAGGVNELAAIDQLQLTRDTSANGAEALILNIDQALQGNGDHNPVIIAGDVIYVPERKAQVLVFGEVRNPGYYPVGSTTRFLDAIARAGGLTDIADAANVNFTYEINGETVVDVVNVEQMMESGQGNMTLTGGEMLLVPKSDNQVLVLGEVRDPGMYAIRSHDKLLDVIGYAGGLTQSAESAISLTRSSDDQQETITIDIESVISGSNPANNYGLVGGDVIYVGQANQRILVFGAIARPGAYLVDSYTTLLDVLALAGGVTNQAQSTEISVTRTELSESQVYNFDLDSVITQKQVNMMLAGGDVVYVPESRQVLVMGEVARPGAFNLPKGGRILDLLALAGGTVSNYSEQDIVLTRQAADGEQVWVMAYTDIINKQNDHNLLIDGGDVLFVPETSQQVLVLGEVARPGVYTIYEDAKVLDAIGLAGGPTARASLNAVGIYRDGNPDFATTLTMGKDKLLFQGNVQVENPEIRGGDVIYVPETNKPDWNAILGIMGGIRTFQQIILDF